MSFSNHSWHLISSYWKLSFTLYWGIRFTLCIELLLYLSYSTYCHCQIHSFALKQIQYLLLSFDPNRGKFTAVGSMYSCVPSKFDAWSSILTDVKNLTCGVQFLQTSNFDSQQRCAQFRVESTLAHSTQFNFELTFELIFECATL